MTQQSDEPLGDAEIAAQILLAADTLWFLEIEDCREYFSINPREAANLVTRARELCGHEALRRQNERLRLALHAAARQFRFYEKLHRAKPDIPKAETNAQYAEFCENAALERKPT